MQDHGHDPHQDDHQRTREEAWADYDDEHYNHNPHQDHDDQ